MSKEKEKSEDAIERILDVNDDQPVTLYDQNDNPIKFEQHALIPFEDKLYVILKPIDKLEGVEPDQGIIFRFDEDDKGEPQLVVINDDKIIDEVFGIYLKMINEQGESSPKKEEKKKTTLKKEPKLDTKKTVTKTKSNSKTTEKKTTKKSK